jgi:signal transduction histidine kinase
VRRRLALAFAAVTAMVVLAFVLPLAALVQRVAEDRALNAAQQLAAAVAPALAAVDDVASRADIVRGAAATTPGRLSVVLADGTVLGSPAEIDDGIAIARTGQAFTVDADGGKAVLVPVIRPDGTQVIRVLVPDRELHAGVARAWSLLAALAVVLVGVAVAVGDRLARSLVRPIRELAGVAAELGEGNLDARVEPSGPPEIVEVANAQNRLATRIVSLLAAEREAAADLSHRLRTPITALRLEADSLRDPEEAARVAGGVDALTRAVNQVIADARRTGDGAGRATADLAAVARDRAAFWSALADEEGRTYELDVPDRACTVAVAADELAAVLDALIGNVFAHTPAGTSFAVSVACAPDAPARLVVEDDGPGVAQGAEVRGVSAGGGTGLGLDIVRRTAERAGGGLTIGRSGTGGARIEVTFGRSSF